MDATSLSLIYYIKTIQILKLTISNNGALLSVYFSGVLKARRAGLATGAIAGVCYSLLYLLVLSEEYALLFGALAVFLLPATLMVGTRTLDWYRVAESRRSRT
jgi:inner membrane protein